MASFSDIVLFLLIFIGGLILELIFSKAYRRVFGTNHKTYNIVLSRYAFFLSFPIVAVLITIIQFGNSALVSFVVFAVLGTFLEWFMGFGYHRIVGGYLWTYHHYPIGKYTSVLSIPIWGMGGVLAFLLTRLIVFTF